MWIFQLFIAAIIAGPSICSGWGLSKNPHPWMHAYSRPERLTPCSTTGRLPSNSRLPRTCKS
jgi:hypothetical protein